MEGRRVIGSRLILRSVVLMAAVIAVALIGLRLPAVTGTLTVDNPRSETDRQYASELAYPSIVRFVSHLEDLDGRPCFGLVTEAERGIPREVLNLNAIDARLGSRLSSFVERGGFPLADRLFSDVEARPAALIETIGDHEVAQRILPTIGVTQAELDEQHGLIIGVGPNFAAHREETATTFDRMVFPKPVAPRGAYGPVAPSALGDPDAGKLLDYEVEIGFVLLRAVDLDSLPTPAEFVENIALFLSNDLSDRLPQILYGEDGYTRAKSHPGYLSIGPWMVHGRHLKLGGGGVELHLRVLEESPRPGGSARQSASSTELIRGPWAIAEMLSEIHDDSVQQDNSGSEREVARVRDGHSVLPAGTIILSGTPDGTAIQAPGSWDRVRALVRGNLTMSGARRYFVQHSIDHRQEMGYLSPGDTVECWAEHLGQQRWRVVATR
jgi:2-keto-4-pentenoate hydratase/2-oxohepta-3-ene-1,7-dioic acid hydratase in catechol pathway